MKMSCITQIPVGLSHVTSIGKKGKQQPREVRLQNTRVQHTFAPVCRPVGVLGAPPRRFKGLSGLPINPVATVAGGTTAASSTCGGDSVTTRGDNRPPLPDDSALSRAYIRRDGLLAADDGDFGGKRPLCTLDGVALPPDATTGVTWGD